MSPLISGTQVAPIVRANLKAERTAESRRLIVAGAKPASCMAARHASRWLLPSPARRPIRTSRASPGLPAPWEAAKAARSWA